MTGVEKIARQFLGAEGNMIAADCYGDPAAPPVILMHGGGQTRHSWWRTAEALARHGHYAIAFDHRGHGESDWVASRQYELSDFAGDLRAVISQLDPSAAPVLVGASLGGLTSLMAVGQGLDSNVKGIVLADVVHRANNEGGAQLRGFMTENPDGYASVEDAAAAIERHMPGRGGQRNLDGLRRNLRQRPDGRWIWHWDPAFMTPRGDGSQRFGDGSHELLAAIRAITIPLLLARGERSEIVTPELAAEFLDLLPAAEFIELEGVGHMVAGDDNAPFTRVLLEFLARVQHGNSQ